MTNIISGEDSFSPLQKVSVLNSLQYQPPPILVVFRPQFKYVEKR
jgi:hypothetical protein